jgi:hypothetical protein
MNFKVLFFIVIAINASQSQFFTTISKRFKETVDLLNIVFQSKSYSQNIEHLIERGELQKQYPDDTKFFCKITDENRRSPSRPESVHKLRPGDIDVGLFV